MFVCVYLVQYFDNGSGYWSGRKSLIFGPTDRKKNSYPDLT